ncbi:glycosyltransferase [Acinetobacter sp. 194]|uniref:glycosyltransferase n=1 Tax=Acinetobacter shaoyimingii TaxID=2715164 RepID=UPI00140CB730|nr:glycosyltransferase [Acinetobacter shaoyimingii]NHB58720.1 glycosyltransferase [Acinetobacter shaoyimingii]
MLVSIIVPCYNHSRYLQDRLQSIFNQNYQNFELILLDDASPDESSKILKSYKNHPKVSHCIINEKNSGSTFHQWNKGISLSKGELIWIAESDDIANEFFLEILVNQFIINKNLVLAYSESFRMDSNGNITGDWRDHTLNIDNNLFSSNFTIDGLDYIRRCFSNKNTIPNASGVIFKKQAFLEVGGANPILKLIGDWDIWYKILSKGQIYYHYQCLNYFRYHDNSVIAIAFKESNNPIESRLQGIHFYKNLYYFFKNENTIKNKLKKSLHKAIKDTIFLAKEDPIKYSEEIKFAKLTRFIFFKLKYILLTFAILFIILISII